METDRFRSVSQRFPLQPLHGFRGFRNLRNTPLHLSACLFLPTLHLNPPAPGSACGKSRAEAFPRCFAATHILNHKGTGQVPLRIPTVRAPATPWLSWLPQPPEHSAAPLRLPRPTQTASTPSLIRLRRPSEESGWLCRVCHSTASRGAFHSKPRIRQFCRRESSFRSVQFLNCGVTSLAPPQTP